jgi:hypothetical protein
MITGSSLITGCLTFVCLYQDSKSYPIKACFQQHSSVKSGRMGFYSWAGVGTISVGRNTEQAMAMSWLRTPKSTRGHVMDQPVGSDMTMHAAAASSDLASLHRMITSSSCTLEDVNMPDHVGIIALPSHLPPFVLSTSPTLPLFLSPSPSPSLPPLPTCLSRPHTIGSRPSIYAAPMQLNFHHRVSNLFRVSFTSLQYGRTPLHFAAWHGGIEAAKMLLKAGADSDSRTRDGL